MREGVQRLFLPYYYHFLARFARQYYTNILLVYKYYKLNVQYGTVILSLYSPYPNYDKNPTFNPLLLGIFSYYSCLELHVFTPFKLEIFWGRTPRPPIPNTFYNIKSTMSCVYLCREGLAMP